MIVEGLILLLFLWCLIDLLVMTRSSISLVRYCVMIFYDNFDYDASSICFLVIDFTWMLLGYGGCLSILDVLLFLKVDSLSFHYYQLQRYTCEFVISKNVNLEANSLYSNCLVLAPLFLFSLSFNFFASICWAWVINREISIPLICMANLHSLTTKLVNPNNKLTHMSSRVK